jgi:DNA/RNA endonuclease YhcR with UshA esterase domain
MVRGRVGVFASGRVGVWGSGRGWVVGCLLLLFLGVGCAATAVATPTAVPIAQAPESTPLPTATIKLPPSLTPTPAATDTAVPTGTTVPTGTATPAPTATNSPTPTFTPTLTATPTETPTEEPTATPTIAIIPIGSLQAGSDERFTVNGRVTATASFSRGYKFTLDDGSGQVVLLMWHNVYDDCWDAPKLNLGATVRATGKVGRFEGELQIEPGWGSQVRVTGAAAAPPPPREIGALGNHVGERVTITGQISRVVPGSQGDSFYVSDGVDEIAVFIWHSNLGRIPNRQALQVAGTRVQVVGPVSVFRNNRQIVPVLPYDVQVLP